jgi:putative IMPACT (imprinted ancient) family translation regulator
LKFVQKEFSCTYEEKKSKFIAFLMPFKMFDEVMTKLINEHPKARHFVYAYRHLNEFDQIVENSSDDGEPKGTSGKPCLAVLAGNELINTA